MPLPAPWTAKAVAARFDEAAATMRRLPAVRVKGSEVTQRLESAPELARRAIGPGG